VPDANALAGFCFAAMMFLALAPTLRTGGHIRVNLITARLPQSVKRWQELWCLMLTLVFVGYLAYWIVDLAISSWRFGDVSQGILSVPLWIPQAAMAVGAIALVVALLDNCVQAIRGRMPDYERLAETVDEAADR
jgi:TRAP-type C4-dicarboxylate transport system permease small subunit